MLSAEGERPAWSRAEPAERAGRAEPVELAPVWSGSVGWEPEWFGPDSVAPAERAERVSPAEQAASRAERVERA